MTEYTTLPPGAEDARPDADALALYVRAYLQRPDPERLYALWQRSLAHALLLEADPERTHPECSGLSALQLGEGARAAARRMALLLAEAPTDSKSVLGLKIAAYEGMARDAHENDRSHTMVMVETAMHRDAEALGIVLTRLSPDEAGTH
jgi:hypothetical protein